MVMSKYLLVVLVAALGCRSGDVARSSGYDADKSMLYKRLHRFQVPNEPEGHATKEKTA
jgi:pimeloyl-CoA synthetase